MVEKEHFPRSDSITSPQISFCDGYNYGDLPPGMYLSRTSTSLACNNSSSYIALLNDQTSDLTTLQFTLLPPSGEPRVLASSWSFTEFTQFKIFGLDLPGDLESGEYEVRTEEGRGGQLRLVKVNCYETIHPVTNGEI